MGDKTAISWTDATWNPVRGCSRVSEGCTRCYAERVAARFSDPGMPYHGLARRVLKTEGATQPRWTGEVRMVPEHLADPLRWKKPRRIFTNSMSDLFHEKLTNEEIAAVFGVMAAAPQHTFQCLTKRAKRMREWFAWVGDHGPVGARSACRVAASSRLGMPVESPSTPASWPLPNVWLGVSVENQDAADERIPELLETRAAIRFLSCEPLLGAVDISEFVASAPRDFDPCSVPCGEEPWPELSWIIAGCESGPGARPCDIAWLRSLRDQCAAASVPYFLKQAVESCSVGDETAPIEWGEGSKRKQGSASIGGHVIELPYLDGEQHAAFPEVSP